MRASASLPRVRDGHLYAVADMDVDAEGVLYLLCDLSDPESGEYQGQELSLYDPSALFRKRLARHQFDPQLPIRYRWLNVQSSLVLMAVDQSGNALIREAYDPASLYGRQPPAPMGTRNYPLDAEEGIWEAVIARERRGLRHQVGQGLPDRRGRRRPGRGLPEPGAHRAEVSALSGAPGRG